MIAPAPSRVIVKQLKDAGFRFRPGKGSHTIWTCSHGGVEISIPSGHKTISPGVRRQVDNAVTSCRTNCHKED